MHKHKQPNSRHASTFCVVLNMFFYFNKHIDHIHGWIWLAVTSLRRWHYWPWPQAGKTVDTHYTLHSQSLTRMDCIFNQSITVIAELNNVLIFIQLQEMIIVLLVSLASQAAVHCMEALNSAVVVVCLPAYIVIYLRALNWASYSFAPHWSHSRVELSHCTSGHAGIWSYRDPLYTASCLMCAAAKRMLHCTA